MEEGEFSFVDVVADEYVECEYDHEDEYFDGKGLVLHGILFRVIIILYYNRSAK